jgi:xylulokinase
VGIDRGKLPAMTASTDRLGKLRPDVAKEIGLGPGIDVIVSSPDHQTACIGSGAVTDYAGHLYIGTSSWVQAVVPFKKTDVFHSIASFPTAIPGKYQSVNEQDMAGGCLDMLWHNILFYKNQLYATPPENPYPYLDDIAKAVPAGSDHLIFLPWLNGERTPVDDTTLRGGFYNMTKTHTQNHLIRSVLEGVALNSRWSLTYVERFVRRRLSPLNFIGGGAQSDLWCQILADVLNRDIRQVTHPMQANARGAAFIAAVGLGFIDFSDIPGLIRFQRTYHPQPENRDVYDLLYTAFLDIYKKNRSIFHKLNRS